MGVDRSGDPHPEQCVDIDQASVANSGCSAGNSPGWNGVIEMCRMCLSCDTHTMMSCSECGEPSCAKCSTYDHQDWSCFCEMCILTSSLSERRERRAIIAHQTFMTQERARRRQERNAKAKAPRVDCELDRAVHHPNGELKANPAPKDPKVTAYEWYGHLPGEGSSRQIPRCHVPYEGNHQDYCHEQERFRRWT